MPSFFTSHYRSFNIKTYRTTTKSEVEIFKYDNHINRIMEFEVTRLGERGQIVIPQIFRNHLKLKKGDKFMVVEQGNNLILKRLKAPSMEKFEHLLKKTRDHAKKHNLTEKDMWDAIEKSRRKK